MTTDQTKILQEKAKNKKDGVYSFKGNLWVVKSNRFIAFLDQQAQFLQRMGAFNVIIGDLSEVERWDRKKKVVEWLKKQ